MTACNAAQGRHILAIATTFEDGHVKTWHYEQPGTAADAHSDLVRRWKASGAKFERDAKALQLTRHYPDPDRGGPYTDVITHEDIA